MFRMREWAAKGQNTVLQDTHDQWWHQLPQAFPPQGCHHGQEAETLETAAAMLLGVSCTQHMPLTISGAQCLDSKVGRATGRMASAERFAYLKGQARVYHQHPTPSQESGKRADCHVALMAADMKRVIKGYQNTNS